MLIEPVALHDVLFKVFNAIVGGVDGATEVAVGAYAACFTFLFTLSCTKPTTASWFILKTLANNHPTFITTESPGYIVEGSVVPFSEGSIFFITIGKAISPLLPGGVDNEIIFSTTTICALKVPVI